MSRLAPLVAGVDGCPAGWVAVIGRAKSPVLWLAVGPTLEWLMHLHPRVESWAIDIPIGLAEDGPREADALARKQLGPKRSSSVFPTPPRVVVEYVANGGDDYVEACRLAADATGKKISKQAWYITPKIAETRRRLVSDRRARSRTFETHPELCFARLADGHALAEPKKSLAGERRRRSLLARVFGAECIERLVAQTESTRGVAIDDTLDAMACWTAAARAVAKQSASVPIDPPSDKDGLPMAIRW